MDKTFEEIEKELQQFDDTEEAARQDRWLEFLIEQGRVGARPGIRMDNASR